MNAEHEDTLEKILNHPASGNVEWRQVRSLLEAVGTVTDHHNGRVEVALGDETEVFDPPQGQGRRQADDRRPQADADERRASSPSEAERSAPGAPRARPRRARRCLRRASAHR